MNNFDLWLCLIRCSSLASLNFKKSKAILCELFDLAYDWNRCTWGEPFLEPSWSSWFTNENKRLRSTVYLKRKKRNSQSSSS